MKEKNTIEELKKKNKELEDMLEYDKKIILEKITEKSIYLDQVKAEVDAYRKSQKTIDNHNKILDKINQMRDTFLDIAQEKYPKLYLEFAREIYDDNPLDVLRFINAVVKEILEK